MIKIMSAIKNQYKLIVILLLVGVLGFLGKYEYKNKIEQVLLKVGVNLLDKEELMFNQALEEAAKIPDSYWDDKYQNIKIKDKYRVVFVTTRGGEYNYAECFKYASERMGWEVRVYSEEINTFYKEVLDFDPDFILYSTYSNHYIYSPLMAHRSKKYLNNHSLLRHLRDIGMFNRVDPYAIDESAKNLAFLFHGVVSLSKELDVFNKIFANLNKPFNGIGTLPLTPALINEPAEPINLTWCGMGWDKFRSSDDYKNFIKLLSENVPMKVYGPHSYLYYLAPHVYDGYTPSGMEQINAIRKNGIYLLTHADLYTEAGIPTSRIFEALAANVVIISDRHQFAIEHFGDNFLYFDQKADGATMYKQVKAHMDWIKANPEKAKAMAARAHQIFLEKFTVERDLVRIAKMHEYILNQEKEMGLRYPLAY